MKDEPSTRNGNPTMRSTDQQTASGADAPVPAEHAVPETLALAAEFEAVTREQWRELVAGVLRKAGRAPVPSSTAERIPILIRENDVTLVRLGGMMSSITSAAAASCS